MCIGKRSRKGVFMAKNKKGADGRYRYRIYLGKADDGSKKFKSFYGSTEREAPAAA